MALSLWETIFTAWYRVSITGLKISTFCLAINARLSLRMSSSVFPENMQPQITSIHPALSGWRLPPKFGSINMMQNTPSRADNQPTFYKIPELTRSLL
jgi:hypothetical protein